MSQTYFELGGHGKHLNWGHAWWDDSAHAKIIGDPSSPCRKGSPNGYIELILGLKPSGATHLLIKSEDIREIAYSQRLSAPNPRSAYRAQDFESLSPIEFKDVDQLTDKLKTLRPKKGGAPSQANRNFTEGTHNPGRGTFEHGRLLYRILNDASINPQTYGVGELSWTQKTRIISFVYNVKGFETRPTIERLTKPEVLDFGFCEARLPAIVPDYSTAKHIINGRNKVLRRQQPKKPFAYGTSEEFAHGELTRQIKDFFKDYEVSKADSPVILLVSKAEETLNLLRNHNVDVSQWATGIRDLIKSDNNTPASRESSTPDQYGHRRRSRSRSPRRRGSNNDWRPTHTRYPSSSSSTLRYDSAPSSSSLLAPPRRYAPVYVLDVQELYIRVMQMSVDRVMEMAASQFFRLVDEDGWCAGNEAALIIDLWREMISSLPIDEQHTLRYQMANAIRGSSTSGPERTPGPEESELAPYVYNSDDDQDPNDIAVKSQTQIQLEARAKAIEDDPYALDESDHSSDDD